MYTLLPKWFWTEDTTFTMARDFVLIATGKKKI